MDYVFKYTQGFLLMNLFSSEISIFPAIVLNYIEMYLYIETISSIVQNNSKKMHIWVEKKNPKKP